MKIDSIEMEKTKAACEKFETREEQAVELGITKDCLMKRIKDNVALRMYSHSRPKYMHGWSDEKMLSYYNANQDSLDKVTRKYYESNWLRRRSNSGDSKVTP